MSSKLKLMLRDPFSSYYRMKLDMLPNLNKMETQINVSGLFEINLFANKTNVSSIAC